MAVLAPKLGILYIQQIDILYILYIQHVGILYILSDGSDTSPTLTQRCQRTNSPGALGAGWGRDTSPIAHGLVVDHGNRKR
jgi:hypothetical protein